jgi:hypothetical protein
MADFTTDPFTQVYAKIIALLKGAAGFTNIVKTRSLIDLTVTRRDPFDLSQYQTADFPVVLLQAADGEFNIQATSTSSTITQDYELMVATGDLRVDVLLFPLRWQVIKALAPLKDGAGSGLAWLMNARLAAHGVSRADALETGREGWDDLITIETAFTIDDADLGI